MLAKIGRENRFPRDPHMLGLLSWKQEQVEGALYCTVLYCTVLYCTVLYCILYRWRGSPSSPWSWRTFSRSLT